MRVLNWNISRGGGSRITAICAHIEDVDPDLLALTEFQTRNELSLRTNLKRLGYPFIATSNSAGNQNGLLVASRWQLDPVVDQYEPDVDRERWLSVRLNELDLDVLVLHIPGTTDNKFEAGYGISGAKRKELLWEHTITYAVAHKDRRALIMGDFNTGFRIDAEGMVFQKSHYMAKLIDTGFVDTWRHLHPLVREYTWYSKRKDITTGKSNDLNGFRLDYIYISAPMQHAIADVAILHEPRTDGISDHASVVANIDIQQEEAYRSIRYREMSTETTGNQEHGCSQIGGNIDLGVRQEGTEIAPNGSLRARFDLAPGSLPDMTCGLNGQGLVQQFRPTYVTAEWVGDVLKEVKIWGPRLRQDGSLGKRELDHQWKNAAVAGGVKYSELPAAVAARLRSYITANRSAVRPQ